MVTLPWQKHDGFPKKIAEAKNFIDEIKAQPCPLCHKQKLHPLSSEIGTHDNTWEAKIRCDECGCVGLFNNTGFHLDLVYHKPVEAKQ